MKNVLIVTYYFPPYGGGAVIRIHNFVKYLPKFGFLPIVLTVKEKYYEKTYSIPTLLDEYSEKIAINRVNSFEFIGSEAKSRIYGIKEKTFGDKVFTYPVKKLVDKVLVPDGTILWAPHALLYGRKIIRNNGIDIIFSTAPPFSSHIIAYLLQKISGKPFVIDYRDDWIRHKPYRKLNGDLLFGLTKRFEYMLIKDTSKVITSTRESIELFREKYPQFNTDKYQHIPNGYDPDYFKEDYPNNSYEENNSNEQKINFVYTGSLTRKRNPCFFFQALKKVLEAKTALKSKIKITFIGFTHYKHKELAKDFGLNDLVFFQENLSPREMAYFLQKKADVCLLFQRKTEGGKTAIPGKLYEYLVSKKPVLCMDDNGATTKFLRNMGSKLNADYEDTKKIKHLIEAIISNYQQIKKKYLWDDNCLKNFSREQQTETLSQILEKVLS